MIAKNKLHWIQTTSNTNWFPTGKEIEDLVNKNIYPARKQDAKDESDDQSSALGSIGLKPKIVH